MSVYPLHSKFLIKTNGNVFHTLKVLYREPYNIVSNLNDANHIYLKTLEILIM